ncbi:MAG: Bifunctional deaminase-reductase domain protein [Candidatus Collierbacteria bacterium GW2011_GWB1_44_6]|uniref:Bifunctional deaminase-reductase domain protein n=2 Tax=Candidatus Collieribacteriota TaxID=1752725 RepID=A0A0G1MLK9_9BACT|nr:MAG: Bifunctional deaminase-reductase domain protein [Candidatus Collierbacteria bacterium GW2011_GWC2_43_12]KKT72909.1 MAG: Bifunctional deaminase-reductase domain protein [Candidatus Collierbacteria bacterium GW2011_GWB1_44_6]KKT83079.1 MAG: Bifunctional deaminase-reductase domain protein [Microgenomates group bacterium GW2011_GWC1_44_9]
MRKLIVFCHLSLDGIAAIPSGNLDWISYDTDLEKWAEPIVAETDTAVYGHVTYELMKYWKTVPSNPNATKHELEHAHWIESVEKIVFSKSKIIPDWNNTRVISENAKEEILTLKQKPGKNITIFGSPTLANSLIKLGLVDEYHLSVSPVVLGTGKFLFKEVKDAIKLKLVEEKTLKSGAVTLHYTAL